MTTPPVTCDALLTQMSAYLDGDLNATTCAHIEQHAQTCPACAKVIADFRATTGLCRTAADAPLPDSVRELAQARVRALLAGRK
jgi:anti-sigma factor RsiW